MTFEYINVLWSVRVERLGEFYDNIGEPTPESKLWTVEDAGFEAKVGECQRFLSHLGAIGLKSKRHLDGIIAGTAGLPETSFVICEMPSERNDDSEKQIGGIISVVMIVREMTGYRLSGATAPPYRRRGHMAALLASIGASVYRSHCGDMSLVSWVSKHNVSGMHTLLAAGYVPSQTTGGGMAWKHATP